MKLFKSDWICVITSTEDIFLHSAYKYVQTQTIQ